MTDDDRADLYDSLLELADTLVLGFDVYDFADRLVVMLIEHVGADEAGIMLDDLHGKLNVLATSTEHMRLLELMELQNEEGPCLDASSTGELIAVEQVREAVQRWPAFAAAAMEHGVTATYAIPLRLRDRTIGALNLFCLDGRTLEADALRIGRLLANMATIGILNNRAMRKHERLSEQLQGALESRVVIEQAKGIAAESVGLDMAAAFELLRNTARRSNRSISDVARDVIRDRPSRADLVGGAAGEESRRTEPAGTA